jgi:hypothetical protein
LEEYFHKTIPSKIEILNSLFATSPPKLYKYKCSNCGRIGTIITMQSSNNPYPKNVFGYAN